MSKTIRRNIQFYFTVLFWLLISFNVWHATKRGIWDPVSIINSLHLTIPVVKAFQPFDPSLQVATYQYDGQYVYTMTYDPLLKSKKYINLLDHPVYRYQRMLLPLLAHLFSLARPRFYPFALLFVNVFAYLGGGWLVWKLIEWNHWTPWLLLGYFVNTGLLYSTFGTLTEPLAFTLTLCGLLLWQKDQKTSATVCFAASILARETFLIIPLSVLSYEYLTLKCSFLKMLAYMTIIALPYLLWVGYIRMCLPGESTFYLPPEAPSSFGLGRFSLPFVGMWQEALYGFHHLTTRSHIKLTISLAAVTTFYSVVCFSYLIVKKLSFWKWITAIQAIFVVCLRGDLWNYDPNSVRVVIPLFFFLMAWCADEMRFESFVQ